MTTRRYEQRLRAEAAAATRRRVLNSVEHLLRNDPPLRISLEDVARAAGVARSTIYVVFGSRSGLFDALTNDLFERSGRDDLRRAVNSEDAREHLTGGLRAGAEIFAKIRDVASALFAMSALDPDSVGGAITRLEQRRREGMEHLANHLQDQGELHPDVTTDQATDILWMLSSFATFDALYTDRRLSVDAVSEVLGATAERALCRPIADSRKV